MTSFKYSAHYVSCWKTIWNIYSKQSTLQHGNVNYGSTPIINMEIIVWLGHSRNFWFTKVSHRSATPVLCKYSYPDRFLAVQHIWYLTKLYDALMALCNLKKYFVDLVLHLKNKKKAQWSFRWLMTQAFQGGEVKRREAWESKSFILHTVRVFLLPKDLLLKIVFWLYSSGFTIVFLYKYTVYFCFGLMD